MIKFFVFGVILFTTKALASSYPVDAKISDFYGKWMPYSNAASSIVGPIEIYENKIRIGNGKYLIIKNPKKKRFSVYILGKLFSQYIVTYDVLSNTDIMSINSNKLCNFNADKLHMWIEMDMDEPSDNKNILFIDFTKGPPSFAKLGEKDCEPISYSK